MANRRRTLHHEVFCITDMKELLSKRLPKVYRGVYPLYNPLNRANGSPEFYNEGAMDLLTYVWHPDQGLGPVDLG